ncbi:MAG: PAS domain-containing sensor histidine kinase [Gammaproteobacteria bacterium]|nr:PAS domain-containing sensor histidine kinase [Gammaproteobacteria bacterium]MBU1624259.1 PAS domain-containing sensor histidine kinase [Gammaproteobacteria bacterium]MBU1981987.1 PAS domain-containing sensor histidine kinase [Gammaproteobacteria bacterium]
MLAISIASALALASALLFGMMSVSHFNEVEATWEMHNHRATKIAILSSDLNHHIGYGGFIHNFKNLVLRRDMARYKGEIEHDIVQLRLDIKLLDEELKLPEDRAAVRQISDTFEEYIGKYHLAASLIAQNKNQRQIDDVVKVSDTKAIAAVEHLMARINERAQDAERRAKAVQQDAMKFLKIGGILVIAAMLAATLALIMFLQRVVRANELIRRTQERLDILLDTSPDPMMSVDPGGRITRANQMAAKFFGYSTAELLNMTVEQLIPDRYRAMHKGHRDEYFTSPRHRGMGDKDFKLVALTRDGREPNVEISLSHSGSGDDRLATITIRDVTEREKSRQEVEAARRAAEEALARQKVMQNELVQAEKMVALGSLVAGVAHEINTPVGVTLASATHLESETRKADARYHEGELTEEGLEEYFSTARQATQMMTLNSQRASDLIQSFKQVAVDQTGGERRSFDLAVYLDEILLSLRPSLKKSDVEVSVDCAEGVVVDGLPGALSQIVTNLIMNSLTHAFDVSTQGHIDISARLSGEWIELIYRDNGKGIPRELQGKVFEPFFTTRRGSGGSGLGLHLVYNIVYQTLKGTLMLASEPGQGVTFTIRFPRVLPKINIEGDGND